MPEEVRAQRGKCFAFVSFLPDSKRAKAAKAPSDVAQGARGTIWYTFRRAFPRYSYEFESTFSVFDRWRRARSLGKYYNAFIKIG